MQEIKQKVFPICSFGRAENIFYQSQDSLSKHDLTQGEVLALLENKPHPVLPSHLLDRSDWLELGQKISQLGTSPHLLISYGREWEVLSSKALSLMDLGWTVDLIVDRSSPSIHPPPELLDRKSWRWIACPLRFFDIENILIHLYEQTPQQEVLLCFLPPKKPQSLLLNPDEVILSRKWLQESKNRSLFMKTRLLILEADDEKNNFYHDLSLQTYKKNFVSLGKRPALRKAIKTSADKNYFFFKELGLIFTAILAGNMSIIGVHFKNALKSHWNFWLTLGQKIRNGFRRSYHDLKSILYQLLHIILILGHRVRHSSLILSYTLRNIFFRVRHFLSLPLLKIYWFSKYQYESRIKNPSRKQGPRD